MASKRSRLDAILEKVNSGNIRAKADSTQDIRTDENHTPRGVVSSVYSPEQSNYAAAQKTGAPVLSAGTSFASKANANLNRTTLQAPELDPMAIAAKNQASKADKSHQMAGGAGRSGEITTTKTGFSPLKLAGGAILKGTDTAMSGLTSSANMLVGNAITEAGQLVGQDWSGNPISALNNRLQKAKETNQNHFQGNVNAGGKAAKIADELGTATVAAVPQALLALATAGGSAATKGLEAVAKASGKSGILNTIGQAAGTMLKNPQYWLSFLQVAGDGYDEAKADGASDREAYLFALSNGVMNAMVEVGGVTGEGGIQSLPEQLQQGGSAARKWIKTMVDEGKENVVQGIIERGLQNVVYQKGNALASVTDQNAILNPKTAAGEFASGAVVGGILGGGQLLDIIPKLSSTTRESPDTVSDRSTETPQNTVTGTELNQNITQPTEESKGNSTGIIDIIPKLADSTEDISNRGETVRLLQKLKTSIPDLSQMDSVKQLEGNEFPREAGKFTKQVADFFARINNVVSRKGFGDVILDERGAKSDIGHGLGRAKAVTMAAVPEVIQNGQQIDYAKNWKGRGKDSYVFAAPVDYGGKKTYVAAVVLKDSENRFYLHEVLDENGNQIFIKNDSGSEPIKTGMSAQSGDTGVQKPLSEFNISQPAEENKGNVNENYLTSLARDENNMTSPVTAVDRVREARWAGIMKNEPLAVTNEVPTQKDMEELGFSSEEKKQTVEKAPLRAETKNALDKLGVRVDGDMGDYRNTEAMRSAEEGKKKTEKAVRAAIRRLDPTAGEKTFAKGIASGVYTADDIPHSMNRATVLELADYYYAGSSFSKDGVQMQKSRIRDQADQLAETFFKDADRYKPISMLVMNERTPERIMRKVFGDGLGEEINQAYIYPVQANEAEKVRFINRMLDQVRTFDGSDGTESQLTKEERTIVQQVMEDRFIPETVASMETAGAIRSVAENIEKGKDAGDSAKEFGLSAEEKSLAEQLARWNQNEKLLQSGKVDHVKVENAVKKYTEQFDLFYDAINDFLVAHGYDTIGFIKGYAPHMQGADTQNKLLSALKAMGVNTEAGDLPTSISGLTADFKPGKRYNPYFQSRLGSKTDYDIAKAYESYVGYMADVLYHTDDIARLRGAVRYLRKTFGSEETAHAIDHAESLRDTKLETQLEVLKDAGRIKEGTKLSYEDTRKQMGDYIDDLYDSITNMKKYGELVKYLDNYANILAGKQSMADRGMEYTAGRTSLNAGNKLVAAFGRAQVAGNVSSVLNQSAQLSQIMAEVKGKYIARAAADLAKKTGGKLWNIKKSALFDQSDLLTGKKGIDYLTADDSAMDRYVSALFKPADIMDGLTSALAVQSKYNQLIDEGKAPDAAMLEADRFATQIMGSRMKGSRPQAFESKNLISQMLHMFQVEAMNSWEHVSQDIPARYRNVASQYGKKPAARAVATVVTKGLLSAFLLNRITEAAYGGTPSPFDLLGWITNFVASGQGMSTNAWLKSMVNSGWKALFGEDLLDGDDEKKQESKPFQWGKASDDLVYNIMNELPFVRNAAGLLGLGDQSMPLTNIAESVQGVGQAAKNAGVLSGEMGGALVDLGSQLLPGGRQMQKTAQGIQTLANGGRVYGYGDNKRLQYPVEETPGKAAQALLFGNSGLAETRDFYASGASGLTRKQTALLQEMAKQGSDRGDVYDTLQSIRKGENAGEKMTAINSSELSDGEKLQLYSGAVATSESSRPEMYQDLMDKGLSFSDITEIGEKTESLTAEKSAKGNPVSGSKKEKVLKAIDAMKLTAAQKTALYYAQGYAKSTLNEAPWMNQNDPYDIIPKLTK